MLQLIRDKLQVALWLLGLGFSYNYDFAVLDAFLVGPLDGI